jgi:putative flippase GtrA
MLRRIIAARVELMKFGSVGAIAYIVNLGLFNALVHFPVSPLDDRPVTGSLLAGIVSILVARNRALFYHQRNRNLDKCGRSFHLPLFTWLSISAGR